MSESWQNLLPGSCDWCPINCGADRASGKSGKCGADDKLYVGKVQLHYWEEPPISGTVGGPKRGQGPGSGTVFFSNCNMKCVYCQNHEISGVGDCLGRSFEVDQLVDVFLSLQKHGAMNINLVTPTHYRSHLISAVRLARSQGLEIPIVWNSSGYETLASIYALGSTVDVWLPDFKYADNDLASKFSSNKIDDYCQVALDTIEAMLEFQPELLFDTYKDNLRLKAGVVVRHMLLPGHLDNSKRALELLFENFENQIKYSIMNQYTPVIDDDSDCAKNFPELLSAPSSDEYEQLLDFADGLGIKDYYWQDGPASSTSFIPTWWDRGRGLSWNFSPLAPSPIGAGVCAVDKKAILKTFEKYVENFAPLNDQHKLKVKHIKCVAKNCEEIAKAQCPEYVDLAWLIGICHDIGRFEQIKKFGTFKDEDSVDHAFLSVQVLDNFGNFGDGSYVDFFQLKPRPQSSQSLQDVIKNAIYYHNKLEIDPSLDELTTLMCKIIRDADKIDIMRVCCQDNPVTVYGGTKDQIEASKISQDVYELALKKQSVPYKMRKTLADDVVCHLAFIYDINFKSSIQLIKEQGYYNQMLDFHFTDPQSQSQFSKLKSQVL